MPFYPLLILWIGSLLEGHFLAASLLIATVAWFGAFLALYRVVEKLSPVADAPRWALLAACRTPISFFLVAGYTEALFLWFTLSALLAALEKRWGRLVVWSVLAVVTRHQGLLLSLLVLPFVFGAIIAWVRAGKARDGFSALASRVAGPLAAALAGPVVYLGWLLILGAVLHEPFPWEPLGSTKGWNLHFTWPGLGVMTDLVALAHPTQVAQQGAGVLSLALDVGAADAAGLAALSGGGVVRGADQSRVGGCDRQRGALFVGAAAADIAGGEWLARSGRALRMAWMGVGTALLLFCTWAFVLWFCVS
jgi:hypothetical protein